MSGISFIVPKNLKKFNEFLEAQKKKYGSVGVEVGVIKNATGIIRQKKTIQVKTKSGKVISRTIRGRQDGQPKKITIAEEAFFNCKGVPENNIPPRDYQQKTIDENMAAWRAYMKKGLKKLSSKVICTRLGLQAKGKTKTTIGNFSEPPNAPITINGGWMRRNGKSFYVFGKGKNSPLVDNGDLQKAIDYQIIGLDGQKK